MSQPFQPGDFLVFQLEAGFALLRLLAIDEEDGRKTTWHVTGYDDFFPDIDTAEAASAHPSSLRVRADHMALTNRAFESTQVARIGNIELTHDELSPLVRWRNDPDRQVADRSVRLLLGLR